jgi:ribosomal-protein-alanine N-acetyltransferase
MTAYAFRPMSDEEAREISGWRYDPPYDFHDATSDPDDLAELLDPKRRRKGAYYAGFDESGTLVGFLQFERKGQTVEVGLGLRPDLTGRKLGLGYMLAGLEFARRHFSPAGFRRGEAFMHHTNRGDHPFLSMTREA